MSEEKQVKPSIPKPKFDKNALKGNQNFKQPKSFGKPMKTRNIGRGR
jgi:hypothetical protein